MIAQNEQVEGTTALLQADGAAPAAGAPSALSTGADARLDELAEIIRAYNLATDNLQRSHEALRQQVVRLQEQLASADAQLQRSKRLAALGEMAAGIAHEIRNPLGAIQLYAGMLAEDLGTLGGRFPLPSEGEGGGDFKSPTGEGFGCAEEKKTLTPTLSLGRERGSTSTLSNCVETADKICSAVRGLDAIVNDVLSFAREIAPRRGLVDVAALLDRAVETQQPAIDAAGAKVQMRRSPDLMIEVDGELLAQALVNLIRNAVQAITDGMTRRRAGLLTLAARQEDGFVVLTVRDNGPGIAPEHIDRIFNPFFTTRSTGTGLGLAIVHRIVDAHGGTISVHNDGGAVFELRLPAKSLTTEDTESTEKTEEKAIKRVGAMV